MGGVDVAAARARGGVTGCPQCGRSIIDTRADGRRHCANCAHEWREVAAVAIARSPADAAMERTLFAAILAAPDDDEPRLVYADWLMERGDPRGEFIAMQCQPARFDAAAFERAWRAEREHREVWLAPLVERLGPDALRLVFARGFVEKLAVTFVRWREHGDALCAITPLRELEVTKGQFSVAELLRLPATARLRRLILRDQVHVMEDFDRVPPLPELRSLTLFRTMVRLGELAKVRAELRELFVEDKEDGKKLVQLLASPICARLERLHANVDDLDDAIGAPLAGLPIRAIRIGAGSVTGALITALAQHTGIEEFVVEGARPLRPALGTFARWPRLAVLGLPSSDLDNGALRVLAGALGRSTTLRELDLARCRITDGAALIAQTFPALTTLRLFGNSIPAPAAARLRERFGHALVL
jgi:uncharacterized protein (TIGR02996 family)